MCIGFGDKVFEELFDNQGCTNSSGSMGDAELSCCNRFDNLLREEIGHLEDIWLFSLQEPNRFDARDYLSKIVEEKLGSFSSPETSRLVSSTPFIHTCELSLGELEIDCSGMFKSSMSMAGIVYTMNQRSLTTIITDNANQLFAEKLNSSRVRVDRLLEGKFFVRLVVIPRSPSVYRMTIHDKEKMPDFLGNPIRMVKGQNYIIKIKAMKVQI